MHTSHSIAGNNSECAPCLAAALSSLLPNQQQTKDAALVLSCGSENWGSKYLTDFSKHTDKVLEIQGVANSTVLLPFILCENTIWYLF